MKVDYVQTARISLFSPLDSPSNFFTLRLTFSKALRFPSPYEMCPVDHQVITRRMYHIFFQKKNLFSRTCDDLLTHSQFEFGRESIT